MITNYTCMDNWKGDGCFDVKGTIVPGDNLLTPPAQILPEKHKYDITSKASMSNFKVCIQ
jgi:hypothetical protein